MVLKPNKIPRPYVNFKNQDPNNYLKRTHIPPRLSFGELLFRSPFILGKSSQRMKLSCHSCHPNGDRNKDFFIAKNSSRPGTVDLSHKLFVPANENNRQDALRIPSLRGIRYLAPYGHQGKFTSLHEFNKHVIVNVLGGKNPSNEVLDSLTAYLNELEFLPNPKLNKFNRLEASANQAEKQGQLVFQKQGCTNCHLPTAFFHDGRIHRIGSKQYAETSPFSFEGGVKTPTLLNHDQSVFFHNGSFATLAQLINFKEESFSQTFNKTDKKSLIAYLQALAQVEKPFEGRHIAERLVETISLLKIFQDDVIAKKNSHLILKTIGFILEEQKTFLKEKKSQTTLSQFIKRLHKLSKMKNFSELKQKCLLLEKEGQATFVYLH